MAHVAFNTVEDNGRARIQAEVLSALAGHSDSGHWLVSILGLDGRAGFLVTVESDGHVIGAWTFDRVEDVRPRIIQSLELLVA
jgi:hypothetical protein